MSEPGYTYADEFGVNQFAAGLQASLARHNVATLGALDRALGRAAKYQGGVIYVNPKDDPELMIEEVIHAFDDDLPGGYGTIEGTEARVAAAIEMLRRLEKIKAVENMIRPGASCSTIRQAWEGAWGGFRTSIDQPPYFYWENYRWDNAHRPGERISRGWLITQRTAPLMASDYADAMRRFGLNISCSALAAAYNAKLAQLGIRSDKKEDQFYVRTDTGITLQGSRCCTLECPSFLEGTPFE